MKSVLLITTGGTIASRSGDAGLAPQIGSAGLMRYVSGLKRHYHIDTRELLNLDSSNIQIDEWILIARAIRMNCNFLILDEPTAPLSNTETEELFTIVRRLREQENLAVIFISHRLDEILEICEKYTVMRNGKIICTDPVTPQTTTKEIVEKMLGRSFEENFPKQACAIGDVLFHTEHLSEAEGRITDVSINVRRGGIVGIAGLVGAGKSELCKTIFGAYKKAEGDVVLDNKSLKIGNPSDAVRQRIALVPEERRKEGVLVNESVTFNLSAACLDKFCTASFVNRKKANANAKEFVESLGIATPTIHQVVRNLSGGNQQKVAVGKWLAADSDLYIFDESV